MAPGRPWLRLVDLTTALVLAPIWVPLLLAGSLAALLVQGRPLFYRAERIGRGGTPFRMLKLRTMTRDADRTGPAVSTGADPRITSVGRLLRRTKVDELPQFLHVLSGRMSIVGPRPESPAYLRFYTPAGLRSLEAKPGITGYGTLYFFSAERGAPAAGFEDYYLRELLPTKLLLDERCWIDLQSAPLSITLRMLALTVLAMVRRHSSAFSPAHLEARFLRQPAP